MKIKFTVLALLALIALSSIGHADIPTMRTRSINYCILIDNLNDYSEYTFFKANPSDCNPISIDCWNSFKSNYENDPDSFIPENWQVIKRVTITKNKCISPDIKFDDIIPIVGIKKGGFNEKMLIMEIENPRATTIFDLRSKVIRKYEITETNEGLKLKFIKDEPEFDYLFLVYLLLPLFALAVIVMILKRRHKK